MKMEIATATRREMKIGEGLLMDFKIARTKIFANVSEIYFEVFLQLGETIVIIASTQ